MSCQTVVIHCGFLLLLRVAAILSVVGCCLVTGEGETDNLLPRHPSLHARVDGRGGGPPPVTSTSGKHFTPSTTTSIPPLFLLVWRRAWYALNSFPSPPPIATQILHTRTTFRPLAPIAPSPNSPSLQSDVVVRRSFRRKAKLSSESLVTRYLSPRRDVEVEVEGRA